MLRSRSSSLFALLGLAERVDIESHYAPGKGWRIRIGPEAFEGGAIDYEAYDRDPRAPTGLTVRAALGPRADLNVVPERVRQRYPVHVVLTEVRGEKRVVHELPPPAWPEPSLQTPVGRVGALARNRYGSPSLKIVWEHRELSASDAWRDLVRVLETLPDGRFVVRGLEHVQMLWEVDPSCGVRPKLPDRREVIKDAAYKRALRVLAETLVRAFDTKGVRERVAALDLPGLIEDLRQVEAEVRQAAALHPLFWPEVEDVLAACGYVCCSHRYWDEWWETYDDGLCGVEFEVRKVWVKEPLRVRSEALAESLTRQGRYASYHEREGVPVRVVARGVRWAGGETERSPHMGLCETLQVVRADTGEALADVDLVLMPYWDDCEADLDVPLPDDRVKSWCLWRVEPEEAMRLLRRQEGTGAEVLGLAVLSGFDDGSWIYEWVRQEEGEDCVDRVGYAGHLVEVLVRRFAPEREREEERYNALLEVREALRAVELEAHWALRRVRKVGERFGEVAELEPVRRLLEQIERELRLDVERYAPQSAVSA